MASEIERESTMSDLRSYFEKQDNVEMAFIFGSWAKGTIGAESDVDVAVYFTMSGDFLDWEDPGSRFEGEDRIWSDVELILGRDVDLLVLNRAPATVAESALKGIPILIKNRSLFLGFLLRISAQAEDFRQWMEDFCRLKENRRNALSA